MKAFSAISQMYKTGDGNALWHAYVHNDWLETAAVTVGVDRGRNVGAMAQRCF